MKTFELNGSPRTEVGKKATKALRAQNLIPCILYGGKENINFLVSQADVRKLIYTPEIFEVKLTIGDKAYSAVIKDMQFHPVSDIILHMDFFEVDDKTPIVFSVPVKTIGLAEGVSAGGKLSLELRKLKVKALCKNIPERLEVNVESLKLGKTIKAGELNFDNLEIMNNDDNVVIALKLTRAARGAASKGEDTSEAAPTEETEAATTEK